MSSIKYKFGGANCDAENHGAGQFGSVTYIQRLATKGGLAPKGPCAYGTRVSIPYSAFYLFYTAG